MRRSLVIISGAVLLLLQCLQGEWVIRTVAGNGDPGQKGDFGKAQAAQVDNPLSVTRGPDQSIWFCEASSNRVRCIRPDGVIVTVAGNGRKNFSGDRGPALEASLSAPYEVKFDANGDLFIADTGNHAIRKVDMKTRTIQTIAGTGFGRYSGDGDSAIVAHLKNPSSIQFGPDGCLYICDTGNHAIRKLDFKTGIITTVAGTGIPGPTTDGALLKDTPLRAPRSIDFDKDGHLWLTSPEEHRVYRIDLAAGRIHVAAGTGAKGFSGNGGPAREATFNGPKDLAVDAQNNVWIADTENHAIRMIEAKTGKVELVAGTGERGDGPEGNPLLCKLSRVHGVFVDSDGSVLVADTEAHRVRMIRNETKTAASSPVFGKGKGAQELAAKLVEGEKLAEAARKEAALKAQEAASLVQPTPKREVLSKAETAARLEEALRVEDMAKSEAIRALEEEIKRKARQVDQTELALAKREQALARKAQERKMQEMGLKEKERILRDMEGKEHALAARERELGLRSAKEKDVQNAVLDQQMGQKKRELSRREKDLERKAQELRLEELERKEMELAARERDLKRRADDLRLKELERQEQDLTAREQELVRKTLMLKLWELERSENELVMREKALAAREQALKFRNLERQEEEIARREADVQRRAKELALRELENQEADLRRRELQVERRLKELSGLPSDSKPQPPLLPVPIGSDSPVVYPLKPARDERNTTR